MKKEQLEQMLARASRSVQALNRDLARICPAPEEIVAAAKEKRIRQSSQPLSNKLEARFRHHLALMHPGNAIWEQAITFRLANGVRYTPDYAMYDVGDFSLSLFEVKGPRAWDDAIVKLKVAAAQYRWFKWFLVWEEDGMWHSQAMYP